VIRQPICVIRTFNDSMLLKVNGFEEGFSVICWQKENVGTRYRAQLVRSTVIISNLSEGSFFFYLENPDTKETTIIQQVYVRRETPSFIVNRLWNSAKLDNTPYNISLKRSLISALEEDPTQSLLTILYNKFCAIVDLEDFEEKVFYRLCAHQEAYENLLNGAANNDGVGFPKLTVLPNPIIQGSDSISDIKVYKVEKNNKIAISRCLFEDGIVTLPLSLGLFEIHLVKGPYLFNVMYHCNLSDNTMSWLWEDYRDRNLNYLDLVEDDITLSANLEDFTKEEAKQYKEELGITPANPFIPRIKVVEEDYSRTVQLQISGIAIANASTHTFFVAGQDIEFLAENNVMNEIIPLVGKSNVVTVSFNPATSLFDTSALLYVADENGKAVSRVTRCLFDSNVDTNLSSYYEKIRVSEIKTYGKHLETNVTASYPIALSYVQEVIESALNNEDVTIDNLVPFLLEKAALAPGDISKDQLCIEIMKDFITNSYYNVSFFSGNGISWNPITHKVTGEPSDTGYLLCVIANFDGVNGYSLHYVHSFADQALELYLEQRGYFVVFAISDYDYTMSGFLYANTDNNFFKTYLLAGGK